MHGKCFAFLKMPPNFGAEADRGSAISFAPARCFCSSSGRKLGDLPSFLFLFPPFSPVESCQVGTWRTGHGSVLQTGVLTFCLFSHPRGISSKWRPRLWPSVSSSSLSLNGGRVKIQWITAMERNAVRELISKPEPDHRLTVYSSLLYHRPSEIENIIPDKPDSCGSCISYVPSLSLEHPYDTLDVKWPPSNTHRHWQDHITQRWRWKHPPTDVLPLIFPLRSPVLYIECINSGVCFMTLWAALTVRRQCSLLKESKMNSPHWWGQKRHKCLLTKRKRKLSSLFNLSALMGRTDQHFSPGVVLLMNGIIFPDN